MFEKNLKIGGCLIGWALKKKDGRYFKKRFERPIHNTITKSCINNLFEFNGSGGTPSVSNDLYGANWLVAGSGSNNRYGVINFSALGDGTGDTSVDDVDLKHRVTDYTATKKGGDGFFCGYGYSVNDGYVWSRIAHEHTISNDFTIKEVGWFNRIYPAGAYTMSSRVQLDSPVPVESGDTFYTIYQITFNFVKDAEHVVLPYFGSAWHVVNGSAYDQNKRLIPMISTYGYGIETENRAQYAAYAAHAPIYVNNTQFGYWGSSYPSNILSPGGLVYNPNPSYFTLNSKTLKPYVQDSFYRDLEVLIAPPNTPVYVLYLMRDVFRLGDFDENNNFVPNPWDGTKALKFTLRQRISTDLITPTA